MNDDEILREIRGSDAERLLLALVAATGPLGPSSAATALETDVRSALAADQRLEELGLVSPDKRAVHSIELTSRGRGVAARVSQSRTAGPDRWDAVERAVATSLIESKGWQVQEVEGVPVADHELQLAIQHLKQWRLVKAETQGDGTFYVVMPTNLIHEVPGIAGRLRDHFEGASSYADNRNTTTIHGGTVGAVQTGGSHNTQNVSQTITITAPQQAEALGIVGALLGALDRADDDVDDLREAVEAIRDEVTTGEATKSSVKDMVMGALITAGASESGHLISQGLAQLLSVVSGWA